MEELTAERFVIGACLLSADAVRFAEAIIHPSDFYRPQLGDAFEVMSGMRTAGEPIEPYSVAVKLKGRRVQGLEFQELFSMMEATPSAHTVEHYAKEVREKAVKRALRAAGQKLMQQAGEDFTPPAKALSDTLEALRAIRENTPGSSLRAKKLAEILAVEEQRDWIVEGLLERGDRMIITGHEGLGKTTWIRQMAILFAAGINPITLDHIDPVQVLVVDVENTESQWRHEVRGMTVNAAKYGQTDPAASLDVVCTGRLDVTKDKGLGAIHRLVDEHSPQILFIGPIYKLVPHGISNDDDAAPLITALDSLRDRGLAMIMEGHSPKASSGNARDLSPRGSAALMGWPEFGFGLAPDGDGAAVTRWRGDRDRNRHWPHQLHKGGPFPWTADNIHPETRRRYYGWDKPKEAGATW